MRPGILTAVRFEMRAYGTRDEIEATLHSAYLGRRSERRILEIEQAARELWRGADRVICSGIVYIVTDDDDGGLSPE